MNENRAINEIKELLREHHCIGIVQQWHNSIAFYVIRAEEMRSATPWKSGDLISTMFEQFYDVVPSGKAAMICSAGYSGSFSLETVLRSLKERWGMV